MPSSIAAVTIGQSPRTDITGEIAPLLGPGVRLIEAGALDGLSREDIAALAPVGDDHTLVTRLRDGTEVLVAHRRILPLVQACLDRVQDEAELILMLCTGTFPSFRTRRLLLYPDRLLFQTARAVASDGRLGVLTPSARQIPHQERRWREVGSMVVVRAFSPYRQGDDLEAACAALASARVDLVVLDCLGYTVALKRQVVEKVRRPALLARTVLARTAAEILGIDSEPRGA